MASYSIINHVCMSFAGVKVSGLFYFLNYIYTGTGTLYHPFPFCLATKIINDLHHVHCSKYSLISCMYRVLLKYRHSEAQFLPPGSPVLGRRGVNRSRNDNRKLSKVLVILRTFKYEKGLKEGKII